MNDKTSQAHLNTSIKADEKFPTLWIMMLGTLLAIGPLSIDMYLPALPSMATSFGVSTGFISNSVPAYFIGLVFGQLFYGPLSDRIGRVKPVYIGMSVFIIATMVCLHTDSAYVLFVARTFQALGACVTSVVTRAAIRDKLPPKQMARAFALLVLVMGIAPIFAPSIGAFLLQFYDWHMIFWILLVYAGINIILCKLFFTETLSDKYRNTTPISKVFSQYLDLLKDPRFNLPALGGGMLMGAMFTYISSASELFMDGYGISETGFSLIFSSNAVGFIALTQLNQFLVQRFRLITIFRFGAALQVLSALILMILGLTIGEKTWLPLVIASLFVCISGLGITQPNAGAISLAFQRHRAGLASAMQGALMFSVGIFGGLLLNIFPINPVAKLGVTMFMLTLIGCLLIWRIDPDLDLNNIE